MQQALNDAAQQATISCAASRKPIRARPCSEFRRACDMEPGLSRLSSLRWKIECDRHFIPEDGSMRRWWHPFSSHIHLFLSSGWAGLLLVVLSGEAFRRRLAVCRTGEFRPHPLGRRFLVVPLAHFPVHGPCRGCGILLALLLALAADRGIRTSRIARNVLIWPKAIAGASIVLSLPSSSIRFSECSRR